LRMEGLESIYRLPVTTCEGILSALETRNMFSRNAIQNRIFWTPQLSNESSNPLQIAIQIKDGPFLCMDHKLSCVGGS